MQTKLSKIQALWDKGEKREALRIAARFFDRSPETALFKQAQSALENPAFYRQIGKSPQDIAARAYAAMEQKFKLAG